MKHAPELESSSDLQTTHAQPMNTTNEQRGPFDWHEFPEGVRDSLEGFAVLMNLGMRDLLSKQMDFLQCMGR